LRREHLVVDWLISSISYGFWDKLSWKGPTKANFLILNFLIFPILMHFFGKMIISIWLILLFYYKKGILKRPKFQNFAYLEGFLTIWNSKTRQMSKIQWIQHTTVSNNTQCKSLKSIAKGHEPLTYILLNPCTIYLDDSLNLFFLYFYYCSGHEESQYYWNTAHLILDNNKSMGNIISLYFVPC